MFLSVFTIQCHFSPFMSIRPVNKKSFLQHVEDLCANDNAKFQEEFAVSVCLQAGLVFVKILCIII